MPGSRLTIAGKTGEVRGVDASGDGTRHGKGRQVEKTAGISFVVSDWTDHVRPVEAVAASTVIVFAVVVEGEGLATLQADRAVEAPTVFQRLHASAGLWNFVTENPGEVQEFPETWLVPIRRC